MSPYRHLTIILWGDRIFVTQALKQQNRRTLMCFDRAMGKLLWQSGVPKKSERLVGIGADAPGSLSIIRRGRVEEIGAGNNVFEPGLGNPYCKPPQDQRVAFQQDWTGDANGNWLPVKPLQFPSARTARFMEPSLPRWGPSRGAMQAALTYRRAHP